jgi:AcrR family transcriptional regulator
MCDMKVRFAARRPLNTGRRRRQYVQAARAQQTEANTQRIIAAAIAVLHAARRLEEITLEDIARKSGVTVRTLLRRFGSRDGLLEAAFQVLSKKFERDRPPTPPGDVDAAISSLVQQYEENGDLNIKGLEQEHELPLLHRMMEYGRSSHRAWIAGTFAPQLAHLEEVVREQRITELYGATDVYLWKVFRRDMRLSVAQTAEAFRHLVLGLLSLQLTPDRRAHSRGFSFPPT